MKNLKEIDFCKEELYDTVINKVIETFSMLYVEKEDDYPLSSVIDDVVHDKWLEILEDEYYKDIEESLLLSLFKYHLDKDIDVNEIIESLSYDCFHIYMDDYDLCEF